MFCPNCGAQVPDGTQFCGKCGISLAEVAANGNGAPMIQPGQSGETTPQTGATTPQTGATTPQMGATPPQMGMPMNKPAAKMDKKMAILLVEAVLVIIAIVVFSKVGNKVYGHKQTALNYVTSVENGDWEKAYNYLDISKGDFTTKAMFKAANENSGTTAIRDQKVTSSSKGSESATVTVSYAEKASGAREEQTVYLTKADKKKLLFFDTWKVDADTYIANDYTIYALKGAKVTLDGVELTDTYAPKDKDDKKYYEDYYEEYDVYIIPQLFEGTHALSIVYSGFDDVNETLYVDSYSSYMHDPSELGEAAQKELIQLAYDDLEAYLNALFANADFSTISGMFASDYASDAKDGYDYDLEKFDDEDIYWDNKIIAIDFSTVEGEFSDSYISEGKIVASVKINVTGTEKYIYEYYDGEQEIEETSIDDYASFEFTYEDGEWKITYFYM